MLLHTFSSANLVRRMSTGAAMLPASTAILHNFECNAMHVLEERIFRDHAEVSILEHSKCLFAYR